MNNTEIFLSTGVRLSVDWSPADIEAVQRDLADPKFRWLRVGDNGVTRWLAIAHIVEVKFGIPDQS